MIRIPPYLKPGDLIGLVCPAGYMAAEKVQACVQTLTSWGYLVKTGSSVGSASSGYFAAPDAMRLADLQEMLDDPNVRAVLCARGGYGLSRIIDRVDFTRFEAAPKWIIGFSDITLLLSHVYAKYKVASMHAPMASAFARGEDKYLLSLKRALKGGALRYTISAASTNRQGRGTGELVGGNLTLIAHAVGTPSDINTAGRILFLEDIGEYLYSVDRMFRQLKRSGKLASLAGLVIGGFTGMKDTERPFGQTLEEIILDGVQEYPYPVCFGFPVSHEQENVSLRIGMRYTLQVKSGTVSLSEATAGKKLG